MSTEFFKFVEIASHPLLDGIVVHYRLKAITISKPIIIPNYSPVFQGLIFNLDVLEDVVFQKKEKINLNHKVYYVGQAVSPSFLHSSSNSMNLIAVNFTPTGLYRLTGIDLHPFTDKIIDAHLIFGNEIITLYEKLTLLKNPIQAVKLIDNFLCQKARNAKRTNKSYIEHSLSILSNSEKISIKELQSITNTSAKTLERRFKSEIGMTPKMLQRLFRFNQTRHFIEKNRTIDWWEIVARFGFYDHSHLISEFQTFSGFTPVQFINEIGNRHIK